MTSAIASARLYVTCNPATSIELGPIARKLPAAAAGMPKVNSDDTCFVGLADFDFGSFLECLEEASAACAALDPWTVHLRSPAASKR